jgi:hypothetical protein
MVAVTNQFENALVDKDFSDFKSAFPESDLYYVLYGNDAMEAHSLSGNPLSKADKSDTISFSHPVLDYPLVNQHVYLPNNLQPSLIFKDDFIDVDEKQIREKDWNAASMLQAKWNEQVWHPNVSDGQWVNLVRYSFMAKVMTPVTSYLVVENDAQKAILKRKQAQVLSGKKSLDLGEAPQRMSEPGLWIVGLLLTVILWRHNRRLHKPTKPVGQKTKSLVNENQFMQNG